MTTRASAVSPLPEGGPPLKKTRVTSPRITSPRSKKSDSKAASKASTKSKGEIKKGEVITRCSVRELEKDPVKVHNLYRAFKRIQELPPEDPNSFWIIGGYHGEPFSIKDSDRAWAGWCQHGNVLFPTWHRIYVRRIEEALRSVSPEDNISIPYWDQTSEESLKNGIPELFLKEIVEIDGKKVPNPLRSYTFPISIDGEYDDVVRYKGNPTVRYPFSGDNTKEAKEHNEQMKKRFPTIPEQNIVLNENVVDFLNLGRQDGEIPKPYKNGSVASHYKKSLESRKYNIFSNTTSAQQGNKGIYRSLEEPHNSMHLSVGGAYGAGLIQGASGDMGENETAGFDPIFFFHHCNIDRLFWVWQKKHGYTKELIITKDKGSNTSTSGQGPSRGQNEEETLNLDTPLKPFLRNPQGRSKRKKSIDDSEYYTSKDCIDIETQLNYTYSIGSLDQKTWNVKKVQQELNEIEKKREHGRYLHIEGINRSLFRGSCQIQAYYYDPKEKKDVFIDHHSILNRRNMAPCRNCQDHVLVDVDFNLENVPQTIQKLDQFSIRFIFRDEKRKTITAKLNELVQKLPKFDKNANMIMPTLELRIY